jgi:hypothetical protein
VTKAYPVGYTPPNTLAASGDLAVTEGIKSPLIPLYERGRLKKGERYMIASPFDRGRQIEIRRLI